MSKDPIQSLKGMLMHLKVKEEHCKPYMQCATDLLTLSKVHDKYWPEFQLTQMLMAQAFIHSIIEMHREHNVSSMRMELLDKFSIDLIPELIQSLSKVRDEQEAGIPNNVEHIFGRKKG